MNPIKEAAGGGVACQARALQVWTPKAEHVIADAALAGDLRWHGIRMDSLISARTSIRGRL